MCDRALDSAELPSEASTGIKLRLTHFVRSLTTVSVFALCTGRQVFRSLLLQDMKFTVLRKLRLRHSCQSQEWCYFSILFCTLTRLPVLLGLSFLQFDTAGAETSNEAQQS